VNEWEYKTHFLPWKFNNAQQAYQGGQYAVMSDEQLTQLGSEGWELVTVIRLGIAGPSAPEVTWGLQYIFKRLKR
jgi:hypothetical protein